MSLHKPALTLLTLLVFAAGSHYLYRMFMADYYMMQAKEIEKGKDRNTAVRAYDKAVSYAPANPEAYYLSGMFYLAFADAATDSMMKATLLQKARDALNEARKRSPENAGIYLALAQTSEALSGVRNPDSPDPTEQYYLTAVSLYPNSAPYRYLLARYYKNKAEIGKAMNEIETMIILDPTTDRYIRHNPFWDISGMDTTVEKALRRALLAPLTRNASAGALASRLAEANQWIEAAHVYEHQVPEGVFADRGAYHVRMGQYLLLGGKDQEAGDHFLRALESASDLSAATKRTTTIYREARKFDQLFVLFEKLRKRFPEGIDIDLYWAQALYEQGHYREALAHLDRFLTSKETAEANFWMAKTQKQLGGPYKAETYIKRAIKWDPQNAQYRHFYAGLLYDGWRLSEALAEADAALGMSHKKNPWHLDRKAWILYRMKRYEEAAKAWESALRLKPGHGVFQRNMDMAAKAAALASENGT